MSIEAIVGIWKKASIASIAVMVAAVPAMWFAGRSKGELVWTGVIAILVLVRHSGNISRLLRSKEQKIT